MKLHGIAYSTLTRGHRLQQWQLGIDPHHFARIYCDACGNGYLFAFPCNYVQVGIMRSYQPAIVGSQEVDGRVRVGGGVHDWAMGC